MTDSRKIILQFPSLRAFLAEYGERISAEGMLLRGEAPPPAGTKVDIEVVVAEGMCLLRARGETLWSGATGTGGRGKAAAVRFEELSESSRTVIGKIVDQRRREGAKLFNLDGVPGPREVRLSDLTMPAAIEPPAPVAPGGAVAGSIFDLEEPPGAPAKDLLSPADDRPTPEPDSATAEPEPAPAAHRPTPPVPLFADPEPAPFDLGRDSALGGEEVAAADPLLESAPATEADPDPVAHPDLSELFGGDQPARLPAGERTEAFPASFVDEVEAELKAAEPSESPEPPKLPKPPGSSYQVVDPSELEVQLGAPVDEPSQESPAPVVSEPDPEPVSERPEPEPKHVVEPVSPIPPVPATPSPSPSEATLRADQAFRAQRGPETVEIPIVEPLPRLEPPTVAPPSAPVVLPTPASPADDNLLSIPELSLDASAAAAPAASESPEAQEILPTSAQALRGAAGPSRHFGTYFLIALLVGALGVAGYFLIGLLRGGGTSADPAVDEPTSLAPRTAPDPATAKPPVGTSDGAAGEAPTIPPSAPETVGATATEPSGSADPAPPEPEAPLTGLDRITWTETGGETTLALVGDGAIPRQSIELVSIGGDQPRLVIKIAGIGRPLQPADLDVGTAQVQRVRTGLQPGAALHVVVDLAAPGIAVRDLAVNGSRVEVRLGAE